MKKLLFATNNTKKVEELRAKLPQYNIITLSDHNIHEDIPETSDTLEGNALQKATYIHEKYGLDCFADDTGLEIEALNGEPGVYSARYAGIDRNANANMNLVLEKLQGFNNKNAKFKTVIALIKNGTTSLFEGTVKGKIINEKRGVNGFGYDPIFIPNGYKKTFAELDLSVKNTISHRALAVDKLVSFLE